jgi:hypothetical protein
LARGGARVPGAGAGEFHQLAAERGGAACGASGTGGALVQGVTGVGKLQLIDEVAETDDASSVAQGAAENDGA